MAVPKRIFPVRAVNNLDDMGIISQLPSDVQAELGRLEDTGFHHGKGLRDLFFRVDLLDISSELKLSLYR